MSTVPIKQPRRLNSRVMMSDREAAEIKLQAEKNEKKRKKINLRIIYVNFKKRQKERQALEEAAAAAAASADDSSTKRMRLAVTAEEEKDVS